MTLTACGRLLGEKPALTCDIVWKEGRLDLRNLNVLKGALSEMWSPTKLSWFAVILLAHLLVGHMWGIVRECGSLSAFSAAGVEGRRKLLKNEIRKKTFRQRSNKRGSRLRGARGALRKRWAGVLQNENLDPGLYAKGLNVLQPSRTQQGAYGSAKTY